MKRTWTIIGVSDVPGSFKWYQSLFGQPETPPGHDDFGQIRTRGALDAIIAAVVRFRGTARQSDDITMMLVSREGAA
jgi:hypothetical protein